MGWEMHLTAWIFGLAVLAIRPLTNKIPVDRFAFMDAIDLETNNSKANIITRWADRATDDLTAIGTEEAAEAAAGTR
jgi:hypothetical protein